MFKGDPTPPDLFMISSAVAFHTNGFGPSLLAAEIQAASHVAHLTEPAVDLPSFLFLDCEGERLVGLGEHGCRAPLASRTVNA